MTISRKLCAAVIAAAVTAAPLQAAARGEYPFNIPSLPLPEALNTLARQAGIQIFFPSEPIRNRRSRPLTTRLSIRAALARLMQGTDLQVAEQSANIVLLRVKRPHGVRSAAAPPPFVEPSIIIVTGYRASIADARKLKLAANATAEVVVAEDIAKFPDLNLAESLQRLPGVAIVREAGEGRRINLRGLGTDFTRVELNGMEVLGNVDSANDSRGQVTRDRSFDFNLFASELFSRVDVEKTSSAKADEGGLAGTVSLNTAKPLYLKGTRAALTFQGGTNDKTRRFDQRYVALFSKNWNDTLGLALSAAFTRRHTEEGGYDTYRWIRADPAAFGPNGPDLSALPQQTQDQIRSGAVFFARGNRYSNWESQQKRLGVTGTLQWQPTKALQLTADGLFGRYTSDRNEYHIHTRGTLAAESALTDNSDYYTRDGVRIPLGQSRINAIQINDQNEAVYLDVSNTNLGTESRFQHTVNTFREATLKARWSVSGNLAVNALVGHESSSYKIPISDKFYTEAYGGIITDYRGSNRLSGQNTYDFNVSDPAAFRAESFDLRQDAQRSALSTAKLDLIYQPSSDDSFLIGAESRRFENTASGSIVLGYDSAQFQDGTIGDSISPIAKIYQGQAALAWVSADVLNAEHFFGVDRSAALGANQSQGWGVSERTTAAYAEYDFRRDLHGMPLRGNAGLRYYRTRQASAGTFAGERSAVDVSYGGVLPSANLVLNLTPMVQARASYSKNINRMDLTALRRDAALERVGTDLRISAGNPNLKPYRADNYDLSFDYDFSRTGSVSIAVFHKRIRGFPGTSTRYNIAYGDTGLPGTAISGITLTPTTIIAEFVQPINLSVAKLDGAEISAQSSFGFINQSLGNLGFGLNFTLLESRVDYATREQSAAGTHFVGPLVGMSKTSGNATLYYENDVWGLRVSANYRGGWIDSGTPTFRFGAIEDDSDGWRPTVYVDLSGHYSLNKHLRLTVDALNVTRAREVQWVNSDQRLHNSLASGASFFAGIAYRY